MKILVTGSNGQLGSEIKYLAHEMNDLQFLFTDVAELDITSKEAIKEFMLKEQNIDIVLNCAAYTAVDKAEDEADIAHKINAQAPKNLAEACHKIKARMIHISTDYVFDGQSYKPYREDNKTNPQSVYGQTKLEGEQHVLSASPNNIIVRTSWLYSRFGHNFVKVMQKLGNEKSTLNVVSDQIGSPTHAFDLAQTLIHIIRFSINNKNKDLGGIYHFSNLGVCSWYDFAVEIMDQWHIDCSVKAIASEQFPQKAKRPFYSVMDKKKIANSFNIEIKHWKHALNEYNSMVEK